MMLKKNKAYRMDCLKGMEKIKPKSVDMVLCDLPYGITENKWDKVIPLDNYINVNKKQLTAKEYFLYCLSYNINIEVAHNNWNIRHKKGLWWHYERLLKDDGVIVLTACQPFTNKLINSNPAMFKYTWVWHKSIKTNFLHAKRRPMREHEDILVFYKKVGVYNPQGVKKCTIIKKHGGGISTNYNLKHKKSYRQTTTGYPASVLKIPNPNNGNFHPTQKPLELGRYLIRTYTNKGDLVLDNTCGSGTFLVAAMLEKRKFIGFETDPGYFKKLQQRLKDAKNIKTKS